MTDLSKLLAMSSAWDSAHEALTRRDTQAFDKAMTRFREVCKQQPREPREAKAEQAQQAAGPKL